MLGSYLVTREYFDFEAMVVLIVWIESSGKGVVEFNPPFVSTFKLYTHIATLTSPSFGTMHAIGIA
jgi:hypothetical protein